jgi:hypothetical protein
MVYNTQNYWVLGLFPSSGILETRDTTFRKLNLFPLSDEWGDTQLGPLEGAILDHWTKHVRLTQLIRRDVTRKYAIQIVIEHSQAWK